MKFKTIVFILFLFLLAISCGQKYIPPTDWKKEKLKGEVKLVYEKTFYFDSTGTLKDSTHWNEIDSFPNVSMEFNNKGYLLRNADFPCMMGSLTTYTYSRDNIYLEKIEGSSFIGGGYTIFKYDSRGRLKELNGSYSNGTQQRDTFVVNFEYDQRGNIIKEIHTDINDTNDIYYTRKYDEANNLVEQNKFYKDNRQISRTIYQYNENGNRIYAEFGELMGDGWGWVSRDSFDNNGNLVQYIITYHDKDKIEKPQTTQFSYELDEKGNWIQMIIKDEGLNKEIRRRKIVYW